MPIYILPTGEKYNIPEEKVNSFLQKYPNAVIETLGKITPLQGEKPGVLAEVNVTPSTDLSLEIPSSGSQEKDTAIERTFGKQSGRRFDVIKKISSILQIKNYIIFLIPKYTNSQYSQTVQRT